MEETLKLILNELRGMKVGQQDLNNKYMDLNDRYLDLNQGQQELNDKYLGLSQGQTELNDKYLGLSEGQQELKQGAPSIKDDIINGLRPYFKHIEKHIDARTDELKDTLEDQQKVIDILAARSNKHASEMNYIKRIPKNQ